MTTKPKIEHNREIPETYGRWSTLAEQMQVGDHVTVNSRIELQTLSNALRAIGRVPRVHLKTLTVFRRL